MSSCAPATWNCSARWRRRWSPNSAPSTRPSAARWSSAALHNIDGTCAALDLGSRQELRKLLDLLAIGPLRYALTGVGAWNEAGIDKMQAFLARWRGSRFATLNAGGNVLVKLTSSSFYVLPESWPSTGYPGPLEYVFNAINS